MKCRKQLSGERAVGLHRARGSASWKATQGGGRSPLLLSPSPLLLALVCGAVSCMPCQLPRLEETLLGGEWIHTPRA